MFELEVTEHDGGFNAAAIRGAWEPAYLDFEGGSVIAERALELADVPAFRVVFYVHDWPDGGVLEGPTGALSLPPFSAVPERLWRLAPYSIVD